MPSVELVVDDADVLRMLRRAREELDSFDERLAEMVAEQATEESRSRGITWRPRTDPDVAAEAEQWWAHFLARGTQAHGPRRRSRMRFFQDGEAVWATWVSGVRADPFHERAVVRARSKLDELLREVLR